ncbi:hypothetical protein M769_0120410 [Bacillus haynesii]|nr:hypothetical protein M769_0120410 [Bacillus haynesii]
MKNLEKGTVVRTVLLFIGLINQTLIMFGKAALPISEDQVNTLAVKRGSISVEIAHINLIFKDFHHFLYMFKTFHIIRIIRRKSVNQLSKNRFKLLSFLIIRAINKVYSSGIKSVIILM